LKSLVTDDFRIDAGNKLKELSQASAYMFEIAQYLSLNSAKKEEYKTFIEKRVDKLVGLI